MGELTRESDNIIREAGNTLAHQRAGGRRKSIGRASAKMKVRHFGRKLRNVFIAVFAIFVGVSTIGWVLNGIGAMGLLAAVVLAVTATIFLLRYPRLKVPNRSDLNSGDDIQQMVGKTELWLEAQRPALPPPAAKLVSGIGLQLDDLQLQLEEVDQQHPTAVQIRKLVGEDLPEIVEGYQRIPQKMRYEERANTTPAKQLEEGLNVVSREIDSITRQLAQGSLDDLAIRTRYLDYKYGEADGLPTPEDS